MRNSSSFQRTESWAMVEVRELGSERSKGKKERSVKSIDMWLGKMEKEGFLYYKTFIRKKK